MCQIATCQIATCQSAMRRRGIEAAAVDGIAANQSPQAQGNADDGSPRLHGVDHVLRA